jgi:hypothetical protein
MAPIEPVVTNTLHVHVHDLFHCQRWCCTMAKRVCILRREAARRPGNRFDVAADPQAAMSYDECLRCEQGDRIGLEFGIRPPKPKPAPTERRCRRCGVLQPISQFSKYTYSSGWEHVCKACRAVDNARYVANKRAREAGQGVDHRFRARTRITDTTQEMR